MFHSTRSAIAALAVCVFWTGHSQAQIAIDLTVDVSESDGIYTYVYTLENSEFSFQGINTFFLTTGKQAVVDELAAPENWFAEYAIEETTGLQISYIGGVSDDGLRCGATNADDIDPGESGTFTIKSPWGPEQQDYAIGRTTFNDESPCFFDGEQLVGMIASPSIPAVLPMFDPCDFDEDGDCDTRDINGLALTISLGDYVAKHDLTGDELVNRDDLEEFLNQVQRINGDADFNGQVEFADFLTLSGNFGKQELAWTDGDFDANGAVAFSDFLILSGNFGKGFVGAEQVPEPSAGSLIVLGLLSILARYRSRRST